MDAPRWKLACFDLDGTLVRRVSTGQHIAAKLGHADAMSEIEAACAAGTATNADVAALDGRHYRGLTPSDVSGMLDDIPVIEDIAETVDWLRGHGTPSCLTSSMSAIQGRISRSSERSGIPSP